MSTNAKIGHGALLKVADDNSPASYITVGEITSITMPGIARDAVDATHSESTQKWREFIAGLKDGGEVSAELNFVPGSTGMTRLLAQLDQDELSSCKITLPTTPAYEWQFDAILTGLESEAPVDDKMTATVTFKVSGKPVLTTS
jgi:predicted secreted protein